MTNRRPDIVRKIMNKNKKKDRPKHRTLRTARQNWTGPETWTSDNNFCDGPESHELIHV